MEYPSLNARNCNINPAPNPADIDIYSNKISETERLRDKRNICSLYPECSKQTFQKKKILTKALLHTHTYTHCNVDERKGVAESRPLVTSCQQTYLSVPPRRGQAGCGGQHAAHLAPSHDEYRPAGYRCHFVSASSNNRNTLAYFARSHHRSFLSHESRKQHLPATVADNRADQRELRPASINCYPRPAADGRHRALEPVPRASETPTLQRPADVTCAPRHARRALARCNCSRHIWNI